jgi:hypothetical protein
MNGFFIGQFASQVGAGYLVDSNTMFGAESAVLLSVR